MLNGVQQHLNDARPEIRLHAMVLGPLMMKVLSPDQDLQFEVLQIRVLFL